MQFPIKPTINKVIEFCKQGLKKLWQGLKKLWHYITCFFSFLFMPFFMVLCIASLYSFYLIYFNHTIGDFNLNDWLELKIVTDKTEPLSKIVTDQSKPLSKIEITEWFRNIFLGLAAIIGLPFLAWQNKTSHESKITAQNSLKETQYNNRRTQENKIFIDCVGQLANDKETIRTAAIHGFQELLSNAERERCSDKENKLFSQERRAFQDKILNILWSFMAERSKKIIKLETAKKKNEEKKEADIEEIKNNEKEIETAQEDLSENYYSQFRLILEIFAEFRKKNYSDTDFWNAKSWKIIWLKKIDLSDAKLNGANLVGAKYNEELYKGSPKTKFPDIFNRTDHGMTDVSEKR